MNADLIVGAKPSGFFAVCGEARAARRSQAAPTCSRCRDQAHRYQRGGARAGVRCSTTFIFQTILHTGSLQRGASLLHAFHADLPAHPSCTHAHTHAPTHALTHAPRACPHTRTHARTLSPHILTRSGDEPSPVVQPPLCNPRRIQKSPFPSPATPNSLLPPT